MPKLFGGVALASAQWPLPSELVMSAIANLTFTSRGLVLRLCQCKTDQEGWESDIDMPCHHQALA